MVKAPAIWLTCLATAALLAGCSGNRQTVAAPTLTAADNTGGPWFCQPATVADEWECDNDPARVANPIPLRKPLIDAPDTMPSPLPERGTGNVTGTAPVGQVLEATPESGQETADTPAATAVQPANASAAAPEEETARAQQIPDYQSLAYQPAAPVSLLDLPPNYYAVQLTAMSDAGKLERFFRETGLEGLSAAQIERDGELFYILLLGIYENFATAERASTDLPAPLDQFDPWIRRLGTLQAAMVRAEQRIKQDS